MVSFYDAAYAQVAAITGGRVITADDGLVANFGPRGLAVHLREFVG
jgi:predicted nucleic acid-binding protein